MNVTLTNSLLRTGPGDQVETSVEIFNDSASPETYGVSVEGIDRAWYEISVVSATLYPGDTIRSVISILPPRASSATAMTYNFRVIVAPQSSPAAARRAPVQLVLEPFHSLGSELVQVSSDRRASNYTLKLSNYGNITLPAQLSGHDPQERIDFRFRPESPTIEPGGSVEVGLTVSPKQRPLLGRPGGHDFLVKTTVPLPGAVPQLLADTAIIYPRIPLWIFWAILLVAATVAVAVGATVVAETYSQG